MTSTFSANKSFEEPGLGDYNGDWNVPVNANWAAIDTCFGGTTLLNAVGVTGTVVLTDTQYRPPIIEISGLLTANIIYELPTGVGGSWYVLNNTTGAFSITIASGGAGQSVIISQGYTTPIICDGTNVGLANTNPQQAAGATTQVQFNINGVLAGSSALTWNNSTQTLTAPTFAGNVNGNLTGNVAGNVTGNVSGSSGSCTGNSATATFATSAGSATTATSATTSTYASTVTGTSLSIGYLNIPISSNASGALVIGDVGKQLYTASGQTINTGIFSPGDVVVIGYCSGSAITLTAGSGVTLQLAGTATTGSRTIGAYGDATIRCIATNTFRISGPGVS